MNKERIKEDNKDGKLRIWHLDRIDYEHDEYISICVIATNEQEARMLAYQHFQSDPDMEYELHYSNEWLDPEKAEVKKAKEIEKGVVKAYLLHG